jgi:hypothetical protein
LQHGPVLNIGTIKEREPYLCEHSNTADETRP